MVELNNERNGHIDQRNSESEKTIWCSYMAFGQIIEIYPDRNGHSKIFPEKTSDITTPNGHNPMVGDTLKPKMTNKN